MALAEARVLTSQSRSASALRQARSGSCPSQCHRHWLDEGVQHLHIATMRQQALPSHQGEEEAVTEAIDRFRGTLEAVRQPVGRDESEDTDVGFRCTQGVLFAVRALRGARRPSPAAAGRTTCALTPGQLQDAGELFLLHQQPFIGCRRLGGEEGLALGVILLHRIARPASTSPSPLPSPETKALSRPGGVGTPRGLGYLWQCPADALASSGVAHEQGEEIGVMTVGSNAEVRAASNGMPKPHTDSEQQQPRPGQSTPRLRLDGLHDRAPTDRAERRRGGVRIRVR